MRKLPPALIRSMTLAELETEIDRVARDILEIKSQIDLAKVGQKQNGVFADADWFARANTALRIRGREHQSLMFIAGKKRKDENMAQATKIPAGPASIERARAKAERASRFDTRFVTIAERCLPAETYRAILEMTKRELEENSV